MVSIMYTFCEKYEHIHINVKYVHILSSSHSYKWTMCTNFMVFSFTEMDNMYTFHGILILEMDIMYTFHGIFFHINGQYVHIYGIFIHINGLYVNVENLSLFVISSEYVFVAGSSECHFILEKIVFLEIC